MIDENNSFEYVLLMGLLPLLGGTINIITAVMILISVLIIASLLKLFEDYLLKRFLNEKRKWLPLLAASLFLAYLSYQIILPRYPEIIDISGIYILLLGVTPVVYMGCNRNSTWNNLSRNLSIFVLLMMFTSIIREFLGQGALMGNSVIKTAPISIFEKAPGAFITLSVIWLLIKLFYPTVNNENNNSEERREQGNE